MSSFTSYNKDNCYICCVALGPYRNLLVSLTNFTETPIYDILESFTGTNITRKVRNESAVCQECFITIEKYDELQLQSEEIQNKLTSLYVKTHSEQVYIKQEPTAHVDIEIGSEAEVKFECKVCRITFFSMKDMASHRHGEASYNSTPRRLYSKSVIDSSKISNNFKHRAAKQGVNYDYDVFQRTFFSENEKDALMKPRKPRGEAPPPKAPENLDEKISEDFKRHAKQSGINYNIETFQRAFGFSELESLTKTAARNAERRETYRAKNVKSDPEMPQSEPKRKKLTVNKTFVETLQESGIKYDLAAFQKAFGYSETIECEIKYDEERNKEFKELKSKGFVDCARCDLRFTNRSNFLQHMKVHKPKDPSLYCDECKRHFKTPACLQIHLATDHGRNNGPVDCPICFKSYQDRSALRSHYYIHSMERSFLCGRCGATFLHKKSFEMHQLMHDDIRNFPCNVPGCTKKFRNTAKLKIHLRVHSGEKIYECPHCPGKRFAQKWGMDLHIKKQHKNEIVPNEICKICGIQIQTKAKMRLHLANVHQVAGEVVEQQYVEAEHY